MAKVLPRHIKLSVMLVLGGLLLVTATVCLLAAVGLDMEHSDMMTATAATKRAADHVGRARTIALLLYVVVASATTFVIFKSGAISSRLHWIVRFFGMQTIIFVCSVAGVLLMLGLGAGADQLMTLTDKLYRSILNLTL